MPTKVKDIALVVTTARGVFFGWGQKTNDKIITLKKGRMCISWTADMRGVTGLAVLGPSMSCKIGLEVPELIIQDVTLVLECTPEAIERWQAAPWA